MNKRFLQSIFCAFLLTFSASSFAQVTIGSGLAPNSGALVDLKQNAPTTTDNTTASKGLGMPRVKLTSLTPATDALFAASIGATGEWDRATHTGLVVYNVNAIETATNRVCPGLHVWDGSAWQPIVPYKAVTQTKTLRSSVFKGLTHLATGDAMWNTLGKKETDYPLGYVGTFTDSRDGEVYNYTRFYVGYTSNEDTYDVITNWSCDQDPSSTAIVTTTETIASNEKFEDGLWMTDHLRAITMPNGTGIPINITNSSTDPQIFYPNNDSNNRATLGVLYNWAAAMGGDPSAIVTNEAGLEEGMPVQGICPNGWVLPSDRQFTDLENGIRLNTSMFSTTPNSSIGHIAYGSIAPAPIGTAMKSTTAINGTATNGTSKASNEAGFNALLAGRARLGAADSYNYGSIAYLWSSSSVNSNNAWNRLLDNSLASVYRDNSYRNRLFSVRCKKD